MNHDENKILNSKTSASAKLKKLAKTNKSGKFLNVSTGVSDVTLSKALKAQTNLSELKDKVKELESLLKEYKDQIKGQIAQIETSDEDDVVYTNNGMRAYKYPKNELVGKVDELELEKLARKRKIYKKVFKTIRVVDEEGLVEVLKNNKITTDEFYKISLTDNTPILEISHVQEVKTQSDEDKDVI